MTKITKGCYILTSEIKDTEEWKKVIDAFVKAGFREYEGYSDDCEYDYEYNWGDWEWVGVNDERSIYHSDCKPETVLTVQEVLSTLGEPEYKSPLPTQYEYNVVEMVEGHLGGCHPLEAILNEHGSNGWKLSSVVGCKYVFMREKSDA